MTTSHAGLALVLIIVAALVVRYVFRNKKSGSLSDEMKK